MNTTLKVKLDLDNDAFADGNQANEVARILRGGELRVLTVRVKDADIAALFNCPVVDAEVVKS